jgi:hypothetical protein
MRRCRYPLSLHVTRSSPTRNIRFIAVLCGGSDPGRQDVPGCPGPRCVRSRRQLGGSPPQGDENYRFPPCHLHLFTSNYPYPKTRGNHCLASIALFIQLDSTHLLRADPRQSDLFGVGSDGKMKQQTAGPIAGDDAYKLALSAPISSHVTLPCTDGPNI